jgi:hypothetical protein
MDNRDTAAESIPPDENQFELAGPGLVKAKEGEIRLTNEEIQQIIFSQQARVGQIFEEDEKTRVSTSQKKPRETWDWDADNAIQVLLHERFESIFGMRQAIQVSAIQELAHRYIKEIVERESIKEKIVIHRAGRRGSIKEFYYRPFAAALRQLLLEFMQREPSPGEVKIDGNLLSRKGGGVTVVRKITAYMKRRNIGTINEYLDERGSLCEYCSEEDVITIQKIYEQIKIQHGFRDPKDLVALLKGKGKRKNDGSAYTMEEIMEEVKKYRKQGPEWFRPALNSGGNVIESISEELYELLKCHFTGAKRPRSGAMTLLQIQREYSIPIGVRAMHLTTKRIGCIMGKDMYIYEGADGVTRYYYSPEFTEKLVEEIRKNQQE